VLKYQEYWYKNNKNGVTLLYISEQHVCILVHNTHFHTTAQLIYTCDSIRYANGIKFAFLRKLLPITHGIYYRIGSLALGSRIKNLSDSLMRDMAKVFKEQEINFEPRWFTFFQLILRKKEIAVTQLGRELNQTHPAVVQVINVPEKKWETSFPKT